ncbi:hypothetical protein QJS10_CPB18g00090 [Acorus calamus]|uniref:Transmembrane protein n=1 Tax=Acorus calamus TaxID=4465 RepID=A0AAV9CMG5_ACOCL|nr:hypothetical protein QJS10_CPB18g00090 [Acorus calamus]
MAEGSGASPSSLPNSSSGEGSSQSQVSSADLQSLPIMYPSFLPGFLPPQNEEHDRGAGLYAVPVPPLGSMPGLYSNTLIPLTYDIPTRPDPSTVVGQVQGQEARPQQQRQRQVVFRIGFQLDLLLILKLAAVVLVFNQDGSKQKLVLLLLFASIVYLYQTGVLAPLMQWLRRAATPTHPPRPVVRAENAPPEGNVGAVNENPHPENGNQPAEHRHPEEPGPMEENRVQWWGLAKEIQMLVIGFITSLLPGFQHHHHHDD